MSKTKKRRMIDLAIEFAANAHKGKDRQGTDIILCSSAKAQEPGSIFQQSRAEVERLFGLRRKSKRTQSDCRRT